MEECNWRRKIKQNKKTFWRECYKKEGCWDWKGYYDKDGYPLLSCGADHKGFKEKRGHRISWLLHNSEIPKGLIICHSCDNPKCTNPDHLFIGTNLDNNRDKVKKGRGNNGSKHGNSKLTEVQVKEIREKFKNGVMIKRIMLDYSISRQTAHDLKYFKIWKHVIIWMKDWCIDCWQMIGFMG